MCSVLAGSAYRGRRCLEEEGKFSLTRSYIYLWQNVLRQIIINIANKVLFFLDKLNIILFPALQTFKTANTFFKQEKILNFKK